MIKMVKILIESQNVYIQFYYTQVNDNNTNITYLHTSQCPIQVNFE